MNKVFIHSDPTPNEHAWCFYFYTDCVELKNYLITRFGMKKVLNSPTSTMIGGDTGGPRYDRDYLYHLGGESQPGEILYDSGTIDFKHFNEIIKFLSLYPIDIIKMDDDFSRDFEGYICEWSEYVTRILRSRTA